MSDKFDNRFIVVETNPKVGDSFLGPFNSSREAETFINEVRSPQMPLGFTWKVRCMIHPENHWIA